MPSSTVGEEDEVSIREAAEAIVEAMDFSGELVVSFTTGWSTPGYCGMGGTPLCTSRCRAPGEMAWSRAASWWKTFGFP